jgi:hypothetical protein
MHSGMCSINDWGINHTIQSLPFGGVKRSGFGAFNGKEGLRGFSLARAVVCDRFPIRLWAPSFLHFPIHPRSDKITQAGLHMVSYTILYYITSFTWMCYVRNYIGLW